VRHRWYGDAALVKRLASDQVGYVGACGIFTTWRATDLPDGADDSDR